MAHDSLHWLDTALADLDRADLRRTLRERHGRQSATFELDGRQVLNFGSNDYLGLAADPRLVAAASAALAEQGLGSGASPLICGRSDLHARLESRLAEFKQTEAALLFPSGFAANQGTIPALAGEGDAIFSDALNHASIVDGCRLSRATVHVYPHVDVTMLENLLRDSAHYRRRLIVTDTLFSMNGDVAPLRDLVALAQKYHCMLMVDEAHATGIFGAGGRGLAEELGVEAEIPIRMGTLSKALGAAGGFVCGSRALIDWLANRARSYVFSTAQPAVVCAAALAALDIVRNEPARRTQLLAQSTALRERLRRQGWQVPVDRSQIVPVIVGEPAAAVALSRRLWDAGLFVPAIRPPSVPVGESLLRISVSYAHTPAMLDRLANALGTSSA
ncbi:MAG: 8-amino-7-oxononanoate synthase [Planctomycetes bacterium]|nr:8-amino-7-oxononanoate synthase [Planctomycetota bacterium]